MSSARRVLLVVLSGLLLALAACSSGDSSGRAADERADERAVDVTGDGGTASSTTVGADPALVRDDVACDAESLGSSEETDFTSGYYVVDGELGALCFGDDDPVLVEAWNELATITPPGQLNDLALFGGFVVPDEGENETLAFVNALDDEGLAFQMSVNVPAFEADRAEASLTMAHEFGHVFTRIPSQLDWSVDDPGSCATWFNGEGCFVEGSLMAGWVAEFWSPDQLATVDPAAEVTPEDGDARCRVDDGFFGPYAATTPEEDFAEAFSAFVFRVEPATPGQAARLEWLAGQPGLVEFRDRAEGAGLGPLENRFDTCGG